MSQDNEYTILAVDDAKDTLLLLEFDLSEEGFNVLTCDSGESALSLIEKTDVNLILLDMYMPGISGLSTLQKIKAQSKFRNIPVIMLSASGDEDQIVAALELGADDYATKPYTPKILLARIRNSLRLMKKTLQLESIARTDFLTKLNNRGSFEELTNKAISQAKRNNHSIVIAMLDIDFFKKVNDEYGHEAGDQSLIDFSAILLESFRDYDILGRIGGEEFAVCMSATQLTEAFNACERFRNKVAQHVVKIENNSSTQQFSFTVSIGITLLTGAEIDYKAMLRSADQALYQAKENGRNNTTSAVPLSPINEEQEPLVINNISEEENMDNQVKMNDDETALPGIDYAIGLNNVLGDEGLFEEILVMFYQDHGSDKASIHQAIENQDQSELKHLVHTLKGVATSIGAMTLFELAKKLDVAVNRNQPESYPSLFIPLSAELDKVFNGITVRLAEKL